MFCTFFLCVVCNHLNDMYSINSLFYAIQLRDGILIVLLFKRIAQKLAKHTQVLLTQFASYFAAYGGRRGREFQGTPLCLHPPPVFPVTQTGVRGGCPVRGRPSPAPLLRRLAYYLKTVHPCSSRRCSHSGIDVNLFQRRSNF